jgi:hypothetical protein
MDGQRINQHDEIKPSAAKPQPKTFGRRVTEFTQIAGLGTRNRLYASSARASATRLIRALADPR